MLSAIVPDSSRRPAPRRRRARHARQRSGVARAVELDHAVGRPVEAEHQLQQRCLAAARGAGDGDKVARLDFEVDVLEHERVGRAVAERNVLQPRSAP